jgi:hypothetical protein
MDNVPLTRSVLFIGEFFSLITTVVLEDELRHPDEIDEDFALRLASEFMLGYYGWDVAAVSHDIGIMDE